MSPATKPHAHRRALVTGAGSGIGRAIAERLAIVDGASVCLVDRDEAAVHAAVASIESGGGRAWPAVVDLGDHDALQAMLGRLADDFGAPDIVVNNAGIAATVPALDTTLERWRQLLDVNLTAPFIVTQHAMPAMRANGWGRVVNIASISGVRAGTGRLAYGTSKAALIAMTRQFAIEAAEWGVTVNAIAPGPIDTPMVRGLHGGATVDTYARLVPMHRYGSPDDVAHAVSFLASAESSYVTGHTLAVDGGFLAAGLLVRDLFDPQRS